MNRNPAQITTIGTTQLSTRSTPWLRLAVTALASRAATATAARPITRIGAPQTALRTALIRRNVGEPQYCSGTLCRAYSSVKGRTGTVTRTSSPRTTPTSGRPHSNSHASTAAPPVNPTTPITANRHSDTMLRNIGPCRRRVEISATTVMATAIRALHATPFASRRWATTENTVQGRRPTTNPSCSCRQRTPRRPRYRATVSAR